MRRSGILANGMDPAMDSEIPQPGGLFASVAAALFRRAAHLMADEAAAARIAEVLFVRFVIYGQAQELDTRARWAWIYRVVTNYCLRQLPDDARPGGSASPPAVPDMRALRRLDEATQNIVVLARLDGLTPDELAEVLGLPAKLIRRRITAGANLKKPGERRAAASAAVPSEHPSLLALDRDRGLHAEHIAGCPRCRAIVAEADRLIDHFIREIAPGATARVAAAVHAERARRASGPRWTRVLWLGGGMVLVASLALLVARPPVTERALRPYAGEKGASRTKAAGILIGVRRGNEVRALDPSVALRAGDRLQFRVRLERPRYLELRVRSGDGDVRVFPNHGTQAAEVRSGQALDRDYVVGAPKQPLERLWIIGLFADRPFPLDSRPDSSVEIVPVRADVER
jgi:DNA-directed RNA polymerase specialized sigma24 family protein